MKLSINWIRDFVNLDGIDIDTLIQKFTLATAEVEEIQHVGQDIQNVVDQACDQLDIQLSEENQKQIAELMKKIEGLDLDVDKLKDQAKDLYQKLENLDFHVDKESVGNFFTRIIDAIVKFFQGLFGK